MVKDKFQLILVEWKDTTGTSAWRDIAKIQEIRPLICKTVGWRLHETEEALTMASSHNSQDDWGDVSVIPKSSILRILKLRKRTKDG